MTDEARRSVSVEKRRSIVMSQTGSGVASPVASTSPMPSPAKAGGVLGSLRGFGSMRHISDPSLPTLGSPPSSASRMKFTDAFKTLSTSLTKSTESEDSQKNFLSMIEASGRSRKGTVKIKPVKKKKMQLATRDLGNGVIRFYLEETKEDEDESSVSSPSSGKHRVVSDGADNKREHVYKELCDTEKTFVLHLQIAVQEFMTPIQHDAEKFKIPLDAASRIFSNLEMILKFHQTFLLELTSNGAEGVAAVFKKYSDFMKLYFVYVKNYSVSMEMLHELRSNRSFMKFLSEATMNEFCRGQDISSYLIMPIQRIPRYVLLLQQLQKYSTSSEESDSLLEALDKVCSIASQIDESKKQLEEMNELISIQNKITGTESISIFAPHRHLLKQFHVKELVGGFLSALKPIKHRIVYLFTDLLIWCSSEHEFKGQLNIAHRSFCINDFNYKEANAVELFSDGTQLFLILDEETVKTNLIKSTLQAAENLK